MADAHISQLKERLEGHRVVALSTNTLTLDDGAIIKLYPSYEGCTCVTTEGTWTEGDAVDAIITDVSLEVTHAHVPREKGSEERYSAAVIKVLHDNNVVARGSCIATSGRDGFYASVMSLKISEEALDDFKMVVVACVDEDADMSHYEEIEPYVPDAWGSI